MSHARVWINGVDWSCHTIAKLDIGGGRSTARSSNDVATVALSAVLPPTETLPRLGDRIDIAGWLPGHEQTTRSALFTGNITDLAFERGVGDDGADMLSLVAADPLRTLDGVFAGDTPWPIQGWRERVIAVWEAARTAAEHPDWMQPGEELLGLLLFPPHNGWMWSRDIDRQNALQLLNEYLAPHACAVYYRPSTLWPAPEDPADWAPAAWLRSGFMVHAGAADPIPTVHPGLVHATNPTPRWWENLTDVTTNFKLLALDPRTVTVDNPDPTQREVLARVDRDIRRRHGEVATTISTELLTHFLGDPTTTPGELVTAWLDRWQVPTLNLDNLHVSLHRQDVDEFGLPAAREAWMLTAHGAAQVARYSRWRLLTGTTHWLDTDWYEWMVETTSISWHADGWDLTVGAAPTFVYSGGVPSSPDPRNSWGAVAEHHSSWAALIAAHPTWDDVTRTAHPHPAALAATGG